jgi:two-component sensor histidine kinase
MVQCLGKPAEKGRADFKLPVLIRADDERQACQYAASFAHVTHYLMKGKSSHIRMRDDGDCSRGNMVVFSTEEPRSWLSTNFANVFHIAIPVNGKRPSPDFEPIVDVLREQYLLPVDQVDKMWRFDMKAFVDRARNETDKKWKAILDVISDGISPKGNAAPCKLAKNNERIKAVLKNIISDRQDRKPPGEYLERVSTLLNCGQIILCLPQTHYFDDGQKNGHHPDTVIYDSGLTIVLKGNKPITPDELEQCYWIGYKVSTFLASFRGLAEKVEAEVRRQVTHLAARALSHEVGNAGESIYTRLKLAKLEPTALKDIEARTNIAAVAARAVVASGDAVEHIPAADQIKQITGHYLNFSDFRLRIRPYDDSSLATIKLPPAFTLLLNELLRNAYKHSAKDSNQFRHADLDIIRQEKYLMLKLSNQPKDAGKVMGLRDGMANSKSTDLKDKKLGRLHELTRLLEAELFLQEDANSITLAVQIPIHLQL